MKLINNFNSLCYLHLFTTLVFLFDYSFTATLSAKVQKTTSKEIIKDIKRLDANMTDLYNDISELKNITHNSLTSNDTLNDLKGLNLSTSKNLTQSQSVTNSNKTILSDFNTKLGTSLNNLRNFHKTLQRKIKGFEERNKKEYEDSPPKTNRKKKNLQDDDSILLYNSLSLLMLTMLAAGVLGVIFIMYFSFRSEEK